jgi:hypothetical protein
MTKVILAALLMGCAVDGGGGEPAESQVEQNDLNSTPVNNCAYSGGYNWCQDFYSGKWCTDAHSTTGWDLSYCTWSGWNAEGNYCGNPSYYPDHEWGHAHLHCD